MLPSRVVDHSKKLPGFNCEVQDLLLDEVDLNQEVPDLRSGGIPHNLTPGHVCVVDLICILCYQTDTAVERFCFFACASCVTFILEQ